MKIDATKIRLIMANKEVNQAQLADEAGMSRQWLGILLERGYSSAQMINKIAQALNVDPLELVKKEAQP